MFVPFLHSITCVVDTAFSWQRNLIYLPLNNSVNPDKRELNDQGDVICCDVEENFPIMIAITT